MSEEGNVCRTMAQAAIEMQFPCIQITPGYTRNLEDWARMIYMIAELTKRIEEKINIILPINIVDRGIVECESAPDGSHEMMEINNAKVSGMLMCIHCGKLLRKTVRNGGELSQHFKAKEFKIITDPENFPF